MVNGMVGFHCVKVRKVNIFFLGQRYKILISQLREKRDYLCCIKKIDLFTVFAISHTNVCNFRNFSELYSRSLKTYHVKIWQFYFTNIIAKFVVLRCAFCKHRRDFGFICSVNHFSIGTVCKSQSG